VNRDARFNLAARLHACALDLELCEERGRMAAFESGLTEFTDSFLLEWIKNHLKRATAYLKSEANNVHPKPRRRRA
jgi:hypothetical protein